MFPFSFLFFFFFEALVIIHSIDSFDTDACIGGYLLEYQEKAKSTIKQPVGA